MLPYLVGNTQMQKYPLRQSIESIHCLPVQGVGSFHPVHKFAGAALRIFCSTQCVNELGGENPTEPSFINATRCSQSPPFRTRLTLMHHSLAMDRLEPNLNNWGTGASQQSKTNRGPTLAGPRQTQNTAHQHSLGQPTKKLRNATIGPTLAPPRPAHSRPRKTIRLD
jgi:hypothetical protein